MANEMCVWMATSWQFDGFWQAGRQAKLAGFLVNININFIIISFIIHIVFNSILANLESLSQVAPKVNNAELQISPMLEQGCVWP